MSEIYDSVFRTLINDCKQRLPFVLNEVFGENYGGTVSYDVPVMKMSDYSADDIFRKKLYILIPFYILILRRNSKNIPKTKTN